MAALPLGDILLVLAIVLFSAKLCGELVERVFRIPGVLGELASGVLLSYHAFGGVPFAINVAGRVLSLGPLFDSPITEFSDPANLFLFALGQVGAIVLLFYVGLQTDANSIIATGRKSVAIALGGVVLPFLLGFGATYAFTGLMPSPPSNLMAMALFIGAIMTATSVSVTASVLGSIGRLDSSEGVAILSASVIDDVLAILMVIVVVSISIGGFGTSTMTKIAEVSVASALFWLGMLYGGLKLHRHISRAIKSFSTPGSVTIIAFVAAIAGSYAAEKIGLAMIIGAYATGLLFSKADVAQRMKERLRPVSFILVPLFFSTVGMLIDMGAIVSAYKLAIIITVLAIAGKVIGCGVSAWLSGFSRRQSLIIGVGMIPRGEVALIIEAYALIIGVIPAWIFGVAAFMTIVTTFLAPPLLARLFHEKGENK